MQAVLDPELPPSGNFDMAQWNLRLPVDVSGGFQGEAIDIDTPALSSGYTNEPYFYTGSSGELVFSVPANGAISGSSGSPRCELRETYSNGNLRNWLPLDDEGIHILNGVCTVDALIEDEEVAIAQIHGKVPSTPTIMVRYDARDDPPRIEVPVYTNAAGSSVASPVRMYFPAPELGEPIDFQLKLEATDTSLIIYCTVNGDTQSIDLSGDLANFLSSTFYFKAGAYYTHAEEDKTTQVSFTELELVRGEVVENVFLPHPDLSGGDVKFVVPSAYGALYQLEYADTLTAPFWESAGSAVFGTGSDISLEDSSALTSNRFYRLFVQP